MRKRRQDKPWCWLWCWWSHGDQACKAEASPSAWGHQEWPAPMSNPGVHQSSDWRPERQEWCQTDEPTHMLQHTQGHWSRSAGAPEEKHGNEQHWWRCHGQQVANSKTWCHQVHTYHMSQSECSVRQQTLQPWALPGMIPKWADWNASNIIGRFLMLWGQVIEVHRTQENVFWTCLKMLT